MNIKDVLVCMVVVVVVLALVVRSICFAKSLFRLVVRVAEESGQEGERQIDVQAHGQQRRNGEKGARRNLL